MPRSPWGSSCRWAVCSLDHTSVGEGVDLHKEPQRFAILLLKDSELHSSCEPVGSAEAKDEGIKRQGINQVHQQVYEALHNHHQQPELQKPV